MRRFSRKTRRNYLRDVRHFARFLGRSPDTATADDIRQFQIAQHDAGMPAPTMNNIVPALRFLFTITLDRPDLAHKMVRAKHPRNLPIALSPDEVARLLDATTNLKHRAALSVADGAGLAWRKSRRSKLVTSTANACCSGSSAAKAGGTATRCCPMLF